MYNYSQRTTMVYIVNQASLLKLKNDGLINWKNSQLLLSLFLISSFYECQYSKRKSRDIICTILTHLMMGFYYLPLFIRR